MEMVPNQGNKFLRHFEIGMWNATDSLKDLSIHWRLSIILEISNKSVWSNVFQYVKACVLERAFHTLYIEIKYKS